MLKGFKDFIMRGNVMDLAVAVIIGAAFKAIIDKFVEGIVNPLLGMLVGKPNFDEAFIVGQIKFGLVLTATVNFILVAAVIYFVLIIPMNKMKKDEPPAEPPGPSKEETLLAEIRDLLAKK